MPNGNHGDGIPSTLREFRVKCPACQDITTYTTGTWSGSVKPGDDTNHQCYVCKKATHVVIEELCAMCHRKLGN